MLLTVLARESSICEVGLGSLFWSLGNEKLCGFESKQIWAECKFHHVTFLFFLKGMKHTCKLKKNRHLHLNLANINILPY